jgi:hypothetical protein
VLAFPLAVHHLFVLGLIEARFAACSGLGKVLQDAQVQCAAVAVAGHGEHGGIVFAPCVEHRLNGLRAVVIVEQDHSFGGILEALADGQHPVWPRSGKMPDGIRLAVLPLAASANACSSGNASRWHVRAGAPPAPGA